MPKLDAHVADFNQNADAQVAAIKHHADAQVAAIKQQADTAIKQQADVIANLRTQLQQQAAAQQQQHQAQLEKILLQLTQLQQQQSSSMPTGVAKFVLVALLLCAAIVFLAHATPDTLALVAAAGFVQLVLKALWK